MSEEIEKNEREYSADSIQVLEGLEDASLHVYRRR